eukprot:Sspe_Gene.51906::Locus_28789_Transcript_1_1_Confidence_1.000_Length_1253::g.51906::m.51906
MRQSTLWRTLEASGAVPAKVNNGESDFRRALFFRHSGWTVEEAAVAEYWACRNKAAVWDMSSFVKFRIEGPDAARELERLCTLRVDRPVEDRRVVYCCLCNEEGGVEADVTVLREGPETFYMVVGAELLTQTQGYLARHLQGDVTARAVSDEVGVLCVAGPLSRSILTHATNAPPMAMSALCKRSLPLRDVEAAGDRGRGGEGAARELHGGPRVGAALRHGRPPAAVRCGDAVGVPL